MKVEKLYIRIGPFTISLRGTTVKTHQSQSVPDCTLRGETGRPPLLCQRGISVDRTHGALWVVWMPPKWDTFILSGLLTVSAQDLWDGEQSCFRSRHILKESDLIRESDEENRGGVQSPAPVNSFHKLRVNSQQST